MIADNDTLGPAVEMDALRMGPECGTSIRDAVAAEIPLTIQANGVELATLLASPSNLKELTIGFLFTSGFISGIPITIASGAPTHQAVHLSRELGITLIGFAREKSFNIYSCSERISG